MNQLGLSEQFFGIARTGEVVDRALRAVHRATVPGVTVRDLDRVAADSLARDGARSSMLGYDDGHGGGAFPLSVSICVNNEVSGACYPSRVIERGDLVTADLAAELGGWHADAAVSWCVGGAEANPRRAALAAAAASVGQAAAMSLTKRDSWAAALDQMRRCADQAGVVILDVCCGHGIGRAMHEQPALPSRPDDDGPEHQPNWRLRRGKAITIEPVVAWADTDLVRDGWLDRTADGADACFAERTVVLERFRSVVVAGGWDAGGGGSGAV